MVCRVGPACSRGKEWRCPWERAEERIWAEAASAESSPRTSSEQKGRDRHDSVITRNLKGGEIGFEDDSDMVWKTGEKRYLGLALRVYGGPKVILKVTESVEEIKLRLSRH